MPATASKGAEMDRLRLSGAGGSTQIAKSNQEPSRHHDRQASARELVEHDQHAAGAPARRAVLDES
jgi:hypothetical protein